MCSTGPAGSLRCVGCYSLGAAQTTLSYDDVLPADYSAFNRQARARLIEGGAPCTYALYPDNRTITDITVRRALADAYPYRAAWAAEGNIPGVTRTAASAIMPPATLGRVDYNPLPGHSPGTTDPAAARALLTGDHHLGYRIRFGYAADDPRSVAEKNVLVQALTTAGFDPMPVATRSAADLAALNDDPRADVNVRQGAWCADSPSGGSVISGGFGSRDIPRSGLGPNLEAFSNAAVDRRISQIRPMPLGAQPRVWNALEMRIQKTYFPVVVTGYAAVAAMRGSKVNNDVDDTVYGMPTWKDLWLG